MNDSCDYMSATFLVEESQESKRIKVSSKKTISIQQQPLSKLKIAELMVERREEGLKRKIGEENKGYNMLKKLGFQVDKGLGKSETGLLLPLDIKEHRKKYGIGIIAPNFPSSKRVAEKVTSLHQQSIFEEAKESFRTNSRDKWRNREQASAVRKAEKVIIDLDGQLDIARHGLWPNLEGASEDCEDKEDMDDKIKTSSDESLYDPKRTHDASTIVENEQKLVACVEYLRDVHCFCLFCGCQYENEQDLLQNCPGKWEDDH